MKYLFTFEEYSHLNIEKTTNRLEGLFKKLKHKLSTYNRLIKIKRVGCDCFTLDYMRTKKP